MLLSIFWVRRDTRVVMNGTLTHLLTNVYKMGPKRKPEVGPETGALEAGETQETQAAPKNKKSKTGGEELLYRKPQKTAMKSDRLKRTELKGVPLGIVKNASFEKNCEALRQNIAVSGELGGSIAWTPAEAHFQMNQFFRNWQTGGDEDSMNVVYRLKAWIEQEWPSQFAEHKNAK